MTTSKLKLNDSYQGEKCKILINATSFVSQDEVNDLIEKYPDYEIREIGYQGDRIGYRYRYAAFEKNNSK